MFTGINNVRFTVIYMEKKYGVLACNLAKKKSSVILLCIHRPGLSLYYDLTTVMIRLSGLR